MNVSTGLLDELTSALVATTPDHCGTRIFSLPIANSPEIPGPNSTPCDGGTKLEVDFTMLCCYSFIINYGLYYSKLYYKSQVK